MSVLQRLTDADLHFIAATVMPADDRVDAVARLREEEPLLDRILDDDRLIRRLRAEAPAIARISPWLLFSVLLRAVRRQLSGTSYTVERIAGERLAVFDARPAGELLADRRIEAYLVELLTSFTHISSFTVDVNEGGKLRRRRFSDFSIEDMLTLAAMVPDDLRFPFLRRTADIALFVTGVFPESVIPRPAAPGQARPPGVPALWSGRRSLEEYESEGRRFYRLASEHAMARRIGMAELLATLADAFSLARKPLSFMGEYFSWARVEQRQ